MKKNNMFENIVSYLFIGTALGSLISIVPTFIGTIITSEINKLADYPNLWSIISASYVSAFSTGAVPAVITGALMSDEKFAPRGAFFISFWATNIFVFISLMVADFSTHDNAAVLIVILLMGGLLTGSIIGLIAMATAAIIGNIERNRPG